MTRNISLHIYLQFATLAVAFSLLYNHTIVKLVKDWSTDDNFSHGFLVPFIAAYMIWHNRDQLKGLAMRPNYWGYVLLLGAMALHVVGNIGAELFTMRFSILLALMAMTLILFGTDIFKKTYIPHIYLILMIPIPAIVWNKIAFPLQLFAARLSAGFISFIGIAIFREGNVLHLANTSLEVVDACSGLRSLTSMIALSAAFAYISTLNKTGKWILFLSAIPIAVAVNIVRLTITAILARYIGPEVAQGFLHDMSGLIVFMVALVLLYLTHTFLVRLKATNSADQQS